MEWIAKINNFIIYTMTFFMVLGALDKCIGNRFGLGEKFEEGFMAMGPLALAMIGVISLAPVLATILKPVVLPIYSFLGADPAMFAGSLLSTDMGAYPLAKQLANSPDAANFSGLILGSMMGVTIVFSIPVALGIIASEDRVFLARGVLIGIVPVPWGCFVGGLVAGYPIMMVVKNLIPVVILAILIVVGIALIPNLMIKGFIIFGKGTVIVITLGLAAIVVETLTEGAVKPVPGLAPFSDGLKNVGGIAIVLAGAFPMVHVIIKVLNKPLAKAGALMGINNVAVGGMLAALANVIPMFAMMKDMDERGKVVAVAFAVSAAFVFGDFLGFTAANEKSMILPMVLGKLAGGLAAVILAMFLAPPKTIS